MRCVKRRHRPLRWLLLSSPSDKAKTYLVVVAIYSSFCCPDEQRIYVHTHTLARRVRVCVQVERRRRGIRQLIDIVDTIRDSHCQLSCGKGVLHSRSGPSGVPLSLFAGEL